MLLNESAYHIELYPTKPSCLLERDRVQPEFGHHTLPSHMDMGGFTTVKGNEEETVGAYPQDRRHCVESYPEPGCLFNRTSWQASKGSFTKTSACPGADATTSNRARARLR
jgi:hypothetical protein